MKRKPGKVFMSIYRVIAAAFILIGAGLSADLLWGIADVTMGAMTIINIPVIFILGKYAYRALRDYEKKARLGGEIDFKASDIDLPHDVDAWQ